MYRGQTALNNRQIVDVKSPPEAGSLESIFYSTRRKYSFVDLLRQSSSTDATSFMFTSRPSLSWGLYLEPMVMRDRYDGILFIDTVAPPHYL